MKKRLTINSLILAALSVAALVSCQTELVPQDRTGSLPSEILGSIDKEYMTGENGQVTKTSYDSEGKYSWLSSDEVSLIVANSSFTNVGAVKYQVKSLSDNGRTAVFSSSASGDLNEYAGENAGIAVYPATIAPANSSNTYGTPYIVLPQEVRGEAGDIVLTGISGDDGSNYYFSTAMSVIKLTINNIPENAAQLRLCTDKVNFPLDGHFALVKDSENKYSISGVQSKGSADDYVYVDLSSDSAIESRAFYFNVPVAEYPAGTLSVMLCDANGGQLMKRTVNATLNLARNECLEVPALTYSAPVSLVKMSADGSDINPKVEWTISSKQIRFCVSTSETNDPSSYDADYVLANPNDGGSFQGSQELTAYAANKPSVSGKYYLHYILQSEAADVPSSLEDDNVVAYGTLPFYYSSEDYDIAGKYIFEWYWLDTNNNVKELNHYSDPNWDEPGDAYMVLSESDDYTKGTVMLTNMWGKEAEHPVYGYVDGSNNQVIFPFAGDGDDQVFLHQTIYGHNSRIRLSQCHYPQLEETATEKVYIYDIDNSEQFGGKDIVLNITTTKVDGKTVQSLYNPRFITMAYTYDGADDWYILIYGRNFYFYKGEEPLYGTDPNMGTWIP